MSSDSSVILAVSIPARVARWLLIAALISLVATQTHAQVLLTIGDTQVAEGNSGTNQLAFTLSLSEPSANTVTVDFYTFGFGGDDNVDFVSTNGTAVFDPGETNVAVFVSVIGDALNETDEAVWLFLTNAINALLIDNRGDGAILNDDPLPALTISNATVTEGNTSATNATFQVNLSAPSGQTVMAQFTTVSGNASAGADFTPQSDVLIFNPGVTNASISVAVIGDVLDENNEPFTVEITNAINATLPAGPAIGLIEDDDPLPLLNIGDITIVEGTGGNTPAAFPLTLSAPSGRALSVDFQTINGVATGGSDFVTTNGTLTFPPGVTNRSLVVQVNADTSVEGTETFSLRLGNPVNVALVRTQALATLIDDETRTLSFTNTAPISAALSGAASPYPTQIELSGLVGTVVKITATLAGVTHSFPDDFDVLLVGPLGQTVMLMSDCGSGNSVNNLTLTFDDAAAAGLSDSGSLSSGTFRPSDYVTTDVLVGPAPGGPYGDEFSAFTGLNPNGTWSLFVYDDSPGGSGAINSGWRLSITLSNLVCCTGGNSDLSVTVTDSPDPVTATSNLTYTARIINNGPAGATSTTFTNLLPTGVNLLSAASTHGTLTTNATQIVGNLGTLGVGVQAVITFVVSPITFGPKTNVMTVLSDKVDPDLLNNTATTPTMIGQLPPLLRIADATMPEGDWGNSNLLFSVTLSRTNPTPVTAAFTTVAGTAAANVDYLTSTEAFTFAPGVTNVFIAIPVIGDITVEPTEIFSVQITGVTNALLTDGTAVGTISNDDGLPQRVQSFSWSAIGTTQYVGAPFPVTVTARDISNNIATTFNGPAKLAAITGSGPEVSIVVSEIDTDANDAVEMANVIGSPVDISGWQVTFYDWLRWPAPAVSFVVPPGTVCGPDEVFTITDNGAAPGTYPALSLGENLFWNNDDSTNMVAVLLRDADGRVIDFVCAVDGYPDEISSPIFIPASQWTGAPIAANTTPSLTYRRTGGSDTHQAANFSVGAPDIGVTNAELNLPFSGTRAIAAAPTFTGNFVNGVWTGSATVNQTAAMAALRASDVAGHAGVSMSFAVIPGVDLSVGATGSAAAIAAGQIVTFTLAATNNGAITANGIFLTNTLPPDFTFVSAGATQGSFTQSGSLVTFNLGSLTPGTTITATVQATPNLGGRFTNTARIAANLPDSTPADNLAQASLFVNSPPAFQPSATQFVNEGGTIVVTNSATDTDLPANQLSYTLLAAPPGALLASNVLTWATTELNGGSTNLVTVKVQDNSTPNLSATQSYFIVVMEINTAPTLTAVDTKFVLEGSIMLVTNLATDADLPANQLSFSMLNGPPGAMLTPAGVFNWTPAESDGPATHFVTVKVQDNGLPSLSTTQTWGVIVSEYNSPPVLFGIPNQFVTVSNTLVVTNIATDPDLPANTLTFSLVTAPPGANLTTNGIFTWTPSLSQTGTHLVTIKVTDDGAPPQEATQSFLVAVTASSLPTLRIAGIARDPGNLNLQFVGPAGYTYVVESRPLSGGNWQKLGEVIAPPVNLPVLARDPASGTQKFYRIRNLTLPYQPPAIAARLVSNGLFNLTFIAPAGRSYIVESRTSLSSGTWSTLTNVTLAASNLPMSFTRSGIEPSEFRVTRYGLPAPAQRIDRIEKLGTNVNLHLTLAPGLPATVETVSSLASANWLLLTNLPAFANQTLVKVSDALVAGPKFYRLNFSVPSVPVTLTSQTSSPPAMRIWFDAISNQTYAVEFRNLTGSGTWQTLTNLPAYSTNSSRVASDPVVSQPQRYYRLRSP